MQQSSKRWNNLSVSSTLQISWRKEGKGGRCTCLPFDAIIMVQQHTSELSGGIEISPVDSGSVVGASTIGDKAPEGRVLGRQEAEIRCIFCILVARVYSSSSSSSNTFPLPAAAHAGGGGCSSHLMMLLLLLSTWSILSSCYVQTQRFWEKTQLSCFCSSMGFWNKLWTPNPWDFFLTTVVFWKDWLSVRQGSWMNHGSIRWVSNQRSGLEFRPNLSSIRVLHDR